MGWRKNRLVCAGRDANGRLPPPADLPARYRVRAALSCPAVPRGIAPPAQAAGALEKTAARSVNNPLAPRSVSAMPKAARRPLGVTRRPRARPGADQGARKTVRL